MRMLKPACDLHKELECRGPRESGVSGDIYLGQGSVSLRRVQAAVVEAAEGRRLLRLRAQFLPDFGGPHSPSVPAESDVGY